MLTDGEVLKLRIKLVQVCQEKISAFGSIIGKIRNFVIGQRNLETTRKFRVSLEIRNLRRKPLLGGKGYSFGKEKPSLKVYMASLITIQEKLIAPMQNNYCGCVLFLVCSSYTTTRKSHRETETSKNGRNHRCPGYQKMFKNR